MAREHYKSRNLELLDEIIDRLDLIFWGRRRPIPIQQTDGSYRPVGMTWKKTFWDDHLRGKVTYGLYPISSQNKSSIMALDIDDHDGKYPEGYLLERINELINVIMQCGIPRQFILVENSGRGYHVWIGCAEQVKTWRLYNCITYIQEKFNRASRGFKIDEFWPSHPGIDALVKYGNLIRLPMGMHQRTRLWSEILDFRLQPCESIEHLHRVLYTFELLGKRTIMQISNEKPYSGPFNPFAN